MKSVLTTETAVLVHFKSVGVVFLVFCGIIIPLLAFAANECNFDSHFGTSWIIWFRPDILKI